MTRPELLAFLRRHRIAVQASVSPSGHPQAAVVGIAVSDAFELVFDTVDSTRKAGNLRERPEIAFVVGWDEEQTAQYEGIADIPSGADLERLKQIYYAVYPDGLERASWTGLIYVRVRPNWIRYSDFRGAEVKVVEWNASQLVG